MFIFRFTVREFYYDEKEIKREREEMTRLLSDKKQQYVSERHRPGIFMEVLSGSLPMPKAQGQQGPAKSPSIPVVPIPVGTLPRDVCSPGAARAGSREGDRHR